MSHRRDDVDYAERIAYLAAQRGLQYWLDIHDPALAAANRAGLPSPAKEVLIAAVIEMGLLNSTHVIAVHTKNSDGSKWIPYELGRVKQRRLFSKPHIPNALP
ncbi:MAG: toll/interleukin-1 receptor domain-containing protein [Pseudomonadota bacterium]|nr:toll/interleukin-1 receptor domain-containing protein [Pseudomonadota bacterium]